MVMNKINNILKKYGVATGIRTITIRDLMRSLPYASIIDLNNPMDRLVLLDLFSNDVGNFFIEDCTRYFPSDGMQTNQAETEQVIQQFIWPAILYLNVPLSGDPADLDFDVIYQSRYFDPVDLNQIGETMEKLSPTWSLRLPFIQNNEKELIKLTGEVIEYEIRERVDLKSLAKELYTELPELIHQLKS